MAHSAPPLVPEEAEEERPRRTPPPPNAEGEADAVMAKVNTSVTEDQEGASLLADAERDSRPSGPHQSIAPEPPRPSTTHVPPSSGEGVGEPTLAPNTSKRVVAGWPDVLEELVNNFVIIDGHHTLMSAVMHYRTHALCRLPWQMAKAFAVSQQAATSTAE